MKLIVNCHSLPPADQGGGGAVKYTQAAIRSLSDKIDLTIIASPINENDYDFPKINKLIVSDLKGKHDIFLAKDTVLFNPANKLTPIDLPVSLPIVSLLHDYQHLLHPEWHSSDALNSRNVEYGFAIQRSDIILCISDFEHNNFKTFYGCNHGRVIYHAPFLYEWSQANSTNKYKPNAHSAPPFFLYPAVPWIHKNHINLVTAFDFLFSCSASDFDADLVLTGFDRNDHAFFQLNNLINSCTNNHRIHIKGHVDDIDLVHLMNSAKGMVFPSMYEGFGIPIVDAMAFSLPVIAMETAAIPEIAGDNIDYFKHPSNMIQMADEIMTFSNRIDSLKYNISKANDAAKYYSSSRMADELLSVFNEAVEVHQEKAVNQRLVLNKNPDLCITDTICYLIDCSITGQPDEILLNSFKQTSKDDPIVFVLHTDNLHGDYLKKLFPNAHIVFSNGRQAQHTAVLQNVLRLHIKSKYIAYYLGDHIDKIERNTLRIGLSLLEIHPDVFSAKFMGTGTPIIKRPYKEIDAIPQYTNIRSKALEFWLRHFSRRLIRRSYMIDVGAPGSINLLSNDLNSYTNFEI